MRLHSMPPPIGQVAAVTTSTVLSAVLAWWLVGDLSYTGSAGEQGLDRLAAPPITEGTALVLGAVSAVLLPLVLLVAWRLRSVLLPAVVLGVLVGAAGRVITAGVIGANIGGGMVLLASPFVLVPLVIWMAVRWRAVAVRTRMSGPTSPSG